MNAALQQVPDAEIFPHVRELSDTWSMGKDGKGRFDPTKSPKRPASIEARRSNHTLQGQSISLKPGPHKGCGGQGTSSRTRDL